MNTAFKPGSCVKMIEAMEDGPRKDIALAEYHYFSGQPERAVIEAGRYLAHPNMEIRLSGCLIYSYANLSLGQISRARYVLNEMRRNMEDIDSEAVPQIGAAKAFCAAAGAVLLHLPLPEKLPPLQTYLPLLPPGLQAFAFYVQAHYTYLKKEKRRYCGNNPRYAAGEVSDPRYLFAPGSGNGLHESQTARTGEGASVGRMGSGEAR